MEIISRKQYADKVDSWLGKEHVIVLVGQRRVGKSFVLKDFILRHQQEPDANIIFVDKEIVRRDHEGIQHLGLREFLTNGFK